MTFFVSTCHLKVKKVSKMSSFNLDLDFLGKFTNRFETRLDKYRAPDFLAPKKIDDSANNFKKDNFPIPQDTPVFVEPSICSWVFMDENEVTELLNSENLCTAKKQLEHKFCAEYPKEAPRKIMIEFMYSILKFAITSQYNVEQTATLLSIFYLSHRFFSMSYNSTAEDVFFYFKEILTYHCLEFSPIYSKVFSSEESYKIMNYFCKIYLRHLPIIRLLSLPNFGYELSLIIEEPPVIKKKKPAKGKDKKEKKGKKGKK